MKGRQTEVDMPSMGRVGRVVVFICAALVALMPAAGARAASPRDATVLRVGLLEFGTVSWEIDTVQRLDLARKHGIRLQVVPLASKNALKVALLSGEVDLIVSDWLWVASLRTHDQNYQFVPYSKAVGAVMVNPASGIKTLADLAGKKIGVAGGPVDKSWLIARAYARKEYGIDLKSSATPQFAAPPLINHLMLDGRLPASINFWQYDARLVAQGMQPLITVKQMLKGLGVDTEPPLLGWVFSQRWAETHRSALLDFIAATYDAKHVLVASDAAWQPLRDKIKPENEAVLTALRRGYRDGVVDHFGAPEISAAGQLFKVIATESHGKLTGGASELPPDVFWGGFRLP
jgi:NitT/TauT family transport system substrate-binding protein